MNRDGNKFLKLPGPGAGWVFESKYGKQLLQEMKNVEAGMWWYKCTGTSPIEVRKSPTFDDDARSGFLVNPKEIVVANIRVKIHGFYFYHLFDGRGWVFELKPGTLKNDRAPDTVMMSPCDDDFVEGEEMAVIQQLVPPTNEVVEVGLWTYIVGIDPVMAIGSFRNGHLVAPGSVVKVDKRANSNGNPHRMGTNTMQNRIWLRLGDGRGWVPETDETGRKLMLLQATSDIVYPNWFRPGADPNDNTEPWMIGIA